MIIFRKVGHLRDWVNERKAEKKLIGFVPTMGALHQGHISLLEKCVDECDVSIVSIFVNPRQFNDPQDLQKYPRPLAEDLQLLIKHHGVILFLPDVEDIYPVGQSSTFDFDPGILGTVMEGKFRPGHFAGVADVMHRLLTIIAPENLYMGQKDFQQVAIVRKLITDTHLHVQLIMCPTLREPNGLAMSSRNLRLSEQARNDAGLIFQTLSNAIHDFDEGEPASAIKKKSMEALSKHDFKPEYFSIVDGVSLEEIETNEDSQFAAACCAVSIEGVRLIDNLIWTRNE